MIINTYYNDYTLYFWYSSLSRYNCIFLSTSPFVAMKTAGYEDIFQLRTLLS